MILLARRSRSARSGPASAPAAEAGAGRLAGLATVAALLVALAGCGSAGHAAASHSHLSDHFGGYPAYLPKKTLNYHSDTVLTGTVQRPALTSQGDGVEVKTAGWSC